MALPAVVLVLLFCLGVLMGGITQLRASDAARAGARAASLGADVAEIRAVVHQIAGADATVEMTGGEVVRVRVTLPVRGLGEWGEVRVRGEAVAIPEP